MKVLAEKGRFRAVENADGSFDVQCIRCLHKASGGIVAHVRRETIQWMVEDANRGTHKCEAKA